MTGYTAETFGEARGITVIAAGADLRATGYRVPGRISPFDPAVLTIAELPQILCSSIVLRTMPYDAAKWVLAA